MMTDMNAQLELKVNFTSEAADKSGVVSYSFGVAQMPTKADVDAAINKCLAEVNEALDVGDARLTHLGDFGYARTEKLEWRFDAPKDPS